MSGGAFGYVHRRMDEGEIVCHPTLSNVREIARRLAERQPDGAATEATRAIVATMEAAERRVIGLASPELMRVWDALDRMMCGDGTEVDLIETEMAYAAETRKPDPVSRIRYLQKVCEDARIFIESPNRFPSSVLDAAEEQIEINTKEIDRLKSLVLEGEDFSQWLVVAEMNADAGPVEVPGRFAMGILKNIVAVIYAAIEFQSYGDGIARTERAACAEVARRCSEALAGDANKYARTTALKIAGDIARRETCP